MILNCGPWTISISITWKLVWKLNSQTDYGSGSPRFRKPSGDSDSYWSPKTIGFREWNSGSCFSRNIFSNQKLKFWTTLFMFNKNNQKMQSRDAQWQMMAPGTQTPGIFLLCHYQNVTLGLRFTQELLPFQDLNDHPHRKEAGTGQEQKVSPHGLCFYVVTEGNRKGGSSGTSVHIVLVRTMSSGSFLPLLLLSPATKLQVW